SYGREGTAGWRSRFPPARPTRSSHGCCPSGRTPGWSPPPRSATRSWSGCGPLPGHHMPRPPVRAGSRAAERLRRLLVVVPYVLRHPGVALEELSRLFGIGEGELVEDLNLLFVSGRPPSGPGDLIDVQV